MRRESQYDAENRAALIRDAADELGRFTIAGLTEHLLKEGLWGKLPSKLSEELHRLVWQGAKDTVKRSIKGEKMLNGCCARVALSAGPGAEWVRWSDCTRKESRSALDVLRRNERSNRIERTRLQTLHEERFKEKVSWVGNEMQVDR